MEQRDDGTRRAVADEAERGQTPRRLMVARLRMQTRLEEEQPSDPRIGQARREHHALTGGTRDSD